MITNNNDKLNKEENRIWLREDGIVQVQISKEYNENTVDIVVKKFTEIAKALPTKPRVLIDISLTAPAYRTVLRKKIVETLKNVFKDPGFKKVALWGARTTFVKTISFFIIRAVGIKNIKYFKTEEEAVEWLKRE